MAKRAARKSGESKAKGITRQMFPEGEEGTVQFKRAKLRELYDKRMPKTLAAIARVGNLSRYRPSPDQAKTVIAALEKAVADVKAQFSGEKVSREAPALPN